MTVGQRRRKTEKARSVSEAGGRADDSDDDDDANEEDEVEYEDDEDEDEDEDDDGGDNLVTTGELPSPSSSEQSPASGTNRSTRRHNNAPSRRAVSTLPRCHGDTALQSMSSPSVS